EWLTINNWGLHTVPPTTGWPIKFGEKHVLSDVTLSAQSSGRLVQHSKDGNVVGENGLYASADKTLGVPIILQRFNRNCIKTGTAYARYATIEITVVNGDQ
ncbi:MAG TPA: hypothetical protein VMQ73_08765, partial [Methylomirabilota bacterium]|nr:hypothetical protein [Methylomirabilota bacterium]